MLYIVVLRLCALEHVLVRPVVVVDHLLPPAVHYHREVNQDRWNTNTLDVTLFVINTPWRKSFTGV